MIRFPNAKINLGLQIVEKRADGFHNIETVFYPVGWCDALELIENKKDRAPGNCSLTLSGLPIDGNPTENLLLKAYALLSEKKKLPSVNVWLHKEIPMGAGLGGGSADAAFLLRMLNDQFSVGLTNGELEKEAARLGSDCAFFVTNQPVYAHGKGDHFEPINCSLKGSEIVIVYPAIHSNTRLAYSRVVPKPGKVNLKKIIEEAPVSEWKDQLVNDFEPSIFHHFPEIAAIKKQLYDDGALYASLSGSGSAVFGIFPGGKKKELSFDPAYRVFSASL